MSVKFTPVQWTFTKWWYDAGLLVAVAAYVIIYIRLGTPDADVTQPIDFATVRMRAFGTCAFLMLTAILCIGPLARLDRRFLPLLYNRRHVGVLTAVVAAVHASHVLGWYFAFSPTPALEALLVSNTSADRLLGFPFEWLGLTALLILFVLAATSHDFWLQFLTAPWWKGLHLSIYVAYAAVVGHVALGTLQDADGAAFPWLFAAGALTVALLHAAAFIAGRSRSAANGDWLPVAPVDAFVDGRAQIVRIAGDERAAVFRIGNTLSAVSNACAHQNGPLGEGRIIDGCITCPWHGFQFRPEDGRSPAPFTDTIPTYNLKLEDGMVLIGKAANPPGTFVSPLTLPDDLPARPAGAQAGEAAA